MGNMNDVVILRSVKLNGDYAVECGYCHKKEYGFNKFAKDNITCNKMNGWVLIHVFTAIRKENRVDTTSKENSFYMCPECRKKILKISSIYDENE